MAILYIKDIADPRTIAVIKEKLAQIKIDGILAVGRLTNSLKRLRSPFPAVMAVEKSDMVAAGLLEGE